MLRFVFYSLCVSGISLTGGAQSLGLGPELPEGSAPPPVSSPYFPDRVHEFVWRNWSMVEPATLALILGTSQENVGALAESMGLPPAGLIPPEMRTRGYITLIRRNWHLLPYDQLLQLLDMPAERLAFALREDDFLWIKLGSLKPKCPPLRYQAPDAAAQRRAAEIRQVVEEEFGSQLRGPAEPRFEFARKLSTPLLSYAAPKPREGEAISLRFVYSYLAVYGDPLLHPELDPYPDGFLQRLSSVGVNGVWLHAVLRDLAPGGTAFPEFGTHHERRLANLRSLVERAGQHGIGVYLYMNEPRAMPASFFDSRPEIGGVREEQFTAMCTSHPEVRQWMGNALAHVFREVPGLGGIYAITASENLTSCASHGAWQTCERCRSRTDTEIIAEVAEVLEEGVHRSNPKAKVILSDWGWKGHGDAREIIARLPKTVWLMSASEWSLPIERGGVKSTVGEYSISSVGPGPRALAHWDAAIRAGVKPAAEIQFNNTCEIASLPYLPVLDLVAEHIHNLSSVRLHGMLIGWTMGGHPSPNFELARQMNRLPAPEVGTVLDELARNRFGSEGASHARRAWTLASEAFRQYPFHIGVVYTSPVQWGPANPLYWSRSGYHATMWGIPYDDLEGWRGPYPPEVLAAQFDKAAAGFRAAAAELRLAVDKAPRLLRSQGEDDLRFTRAAAVHFQSVANQARFVLARDALASASTTAGAKARWRAELKRCVESEMALARELFVLARADSRIGFEPSCHYFYLPLDLVEKVVNCRWVLAALKQIGPPQDPEGVRARQRPVRFEEMMLCDSTFREVDLSNVRITECDLAGTTIDGILVTELLAAYQSQAHLGTESGPQGASPGL